MNHLKPHCAVPGSETAEIFVCVCVGVCVCVCVWARSSLCLSVLISWPGERQRLPRWSSSPLSWLVTDGKTETQAEWQNPKRASIVYMCYVVCERGFFPLQFPPLPFLPSKRHFLISDGERERERERGTSLCYLSDLITMGGNHFLQMMSGLYWAVSPVMNRESIESCLFFFLQNF